MTDKIANKKLRVIHPLLLGIYPVIFLYSRNVGEVLFSKLIIPLAISFAAAVVLWLVLGLACRQRGKAALLASVGLVYFFSYGHFYSLLAGANLLGFRVGIHTYLLLAWTLLFGVFGIFVLRVRKGVDSLNKGVNIISCCLVGISLVTIAAGWGGILLQRQTGESPETQTTITPKAKEVSYRPSIFYIVVDSHPRSDILKELFDHDNSVFIDSLRERGFFVAGKSTSNYVETSLSLSSSLNFRYLDELSERYGPKSTDTMPLRKLLNDNEVFAFFKEQGYRTVAFTSGYGYTELRKADTYLSTGMLVDEFANELINSTPLVALEKLSAWRHLSHYRRLLYTLDKLGDIGGGDEPVFVFAHILAPHSPYVFKADGSFTGHSGPFRWEDRDALDGKRKSAFLDQVKYIDKRIIETVDDILANSQQPPVVIVQADHGVRFKVNLSQSGQECKHTAFAILNALYLPGFDMAKLEDDMTPVNTFRFILNHYFGAGLEILEDKNYSSAPWRFYDFVEVKQSSE